jgi:hypothetical protein
MIQFQVTFRKSSENIMNTMKSISHNRRFPCQDSNHLPPAYDLVVASPVVLLGCEMLNCLNRKTIRLLDGKKPRKLVE